MDKNPVDLILEAMPERFTRRLDPESVEQARQFCAQRPEAFIDFVTRLAERIRPATQRPGLEAIRARVEPLVRMHQASEHLCLCTLCTDVWPLIQLVDELEAKLQRLDDGHCDVCGGDDVEQVCNLCALKVGGTD